MSATPILSICVPTFNRAATLRACLHMLCSQVMQRTERIDVVVCDNASTDSTPQVVAEVQRIWPFVKYFRNDENIGMLRNIDRVVRNAAGKLCWLFGDDDVALPYALEKIMEMISSIPDIDNLAFGCTNAFVVDPDGVRFVCTTDLHCKLESQLFSDGAQIFKHLDYHSLGHITRLIVNRDHWVAQNYDDRAPFEVFSFIRLLIRSARGRTTFYLASPIIGGRNKHSVAYYANHMPLAFTIEFPEFDRLCQAELGLSRKELHLLMRARFARTLRGALKMLLFQREYSSYLVHLKRAQFSLRSERVLVRLLYAALHDKPWANWPRRFIEKRQTNPITNDRSLHASV